VIQLCVEVGWHSPMASTQACFRYIPSITELPPPTTIPCVVAALNQIDSNLFMASVEISRSGLMRRSPPYGYLY